MTAVVPRGGTFGSFAGSPQGLRASNAALKCINAIGAVLPHRLPDKREMTAAGTPLSMPRWTNAPCAVLDDERPEATPRNPSMRIQLDQMLKKTTRAAFYFEWSSLFAFAARTPSAENALFHL